MKKMAPHAVPVKMIAPSGMTLITKEDHSTPIVSFCVYFPGGAVFEDSDRMGLTHLMQRLVLKGTQTRTAEQMAGEIEFLGAYLSPFTGKEAFGVSMSAVSRHFRQGIELFADCIMNPRFDDEELQKEKKNIILEIEKRKDDTLNHCLELCEERLFRDNPYGYNLIGKKETVERITREDVVAWYRAFYSPERMIVAFVGDMRTADVQKKFVDVFGDFNGAAGATPDEDFRLPPREKEIVTEEREKRQVAISLGFLAPPLLSREYFSFKVLDYLLSGMGSRLFINLRDVEGLAYMVGSSYIPRKCLGSFKAYMQTSLEKKDKAVLGLLKELDTLKKEEPSHQEIERVKKYMLGLHEIAMQKKWAQASKLAYYEQMGLGFDFLERYPGGIKRVTQKQVLGVAREYLDTETFTCAMIVPKD